MQDKMGMERRKSIHISRLVKPPQPIAVANPNAPFLYQEITLEQLRFEMLGIKIPAPTEAPISPKSSMPDL